MTKILVPLAEGFEEVEAVTVIDVLRRAEMEVIVAGLEGLVVRGAHGISLTCDLLLADLEDTNFEGIVLPGGLPGASNLKKSSRLREIIIDLDKQNKLVSAICAAPTVLYAAGVLAGKKATCYPGFEKEMGEIEFSDKRVVEDGNVITSRGPGTSIEFALSIISHFQSRKNAEGVRQALLA